MAGISEDIMINPVKDQVFENKIKKNSSIVRKKGSKNLYISFRYYDRQICKTTKLVDTPNNREIVQTWLNRQMEKIHQGSFVFADAFPGSSNEEKEHFSNCEGRDYMPDPSHVLFGDYTELWIKSVLNKWEDGSRKDDYLTVLRDRIIPYFSKLTFYQINRIEIVNFISTLTHKSTKREGQKLSRKRVTSILIPLRQIWNAACDQYRWNLPNPLSKIDKDLPDGSKKKRYGFRFDDWVTFLSATPKWYQPIYELMILTGLMTSEISGLKKSHIVDGYLCIQNSVVRGQEKAKLKTPFRYRNIKITGSIQKILDVLISRSPNEYIAPGQRGGKLNSSSIANRPWNIARDATGMYDKVPYSLRHTFAAWSLCLRMNPNHLVSLMGHSTKKMIYETYGNYIEGLEQDYEKIKMYFGEDFLEKDTSELSETKSEIAELKALIGLLLDKQGIDPRL
jgi:integrase